MQLIETTIIGKILGAMTGYLLFGGSGLVAGLLFGHIFDSRLFDDWIADLRAQRLYKSYCRFFQGGHRSLDTDRILIIGLIALAARMGSKKVAVPGHEIRVFLRIFSFNPGQHKLIDRIYRLVRTDDRGYRFHALRLAELFHNDKPKLQSLYKDIRVFTAEIGNLDDYHRNCLQDIARIFGISLQAESKFGARASHARARAAARFTPRNDPYALLGISRNAPPATIKKAYRKLAQKYHPDALISKGATEPEIRSAEKKFADINAAYDRISSGN